jgi:hypothetical protein
MTDLGRLGGPLLVFGGPYSNVRATEAEKRRQSDLAEAGIVLAGHCGLLFTHGLADGRVWSGTMPAPSGCPPTTARPPSGIHS